MARSSPCESDSSRRRRYFFKVFFPDHSSHRLRIPQAFREHMKGESPGRVSLKGPSGRVWRVDLVRDSDKFFFEDGWKEFVADHSVEAGDFLVFRYDGRSHFTVLVFDSTACEKEGAFLARPCHEDTITVVEQREEKEEEEEVKDELLRDLFFPRDRRARSTPKRKRGVDDLLVLAIKESLEKKHTHSKKISEKRFQSAAKKPKSSEARGKASLCPNSRALSTPKLMGKACLPSSSSKSHGGAMSQEIEMDSKDLIRKTLHRSAVNKKVKSEFQSGQGSKTSPRSSKTEASSSKVSNCLQLIKSSEMPRLGESVSKVSRMGMLISQRRPVTEEEVNRALQMAKSFKSKNPFAIVVMQDSYVYTSFCLNIPGPFVRKHLPKTSKVLTLWDPNGKPWKITYIICNSRGSLSGGWGRFSYANNLEKYDVCVFERIKETDFLVHIFRVVEEITPLLCYNHQN